MDDDAQQFVVNTLPDCDPEIGLWLWMLEDTRRHTLETVSDLSQQDLDEQLVVGGNTVGTLLHHIADADMLWLYRIILQQPPPPDITELLPDRGHDEHGVLLHRKERDLGSYRQLLDYTRNRFLEIVKVMSLDEFRQVHQYLGPTGTMEVTPQWIVYHLMEHESEHRGHIHMVIEGLRGNR